MPEINYHNNHLQNHSSNSYSDVNAQINQNPTINLQENQKLLNTLRTYRNNNFNEDDIRVIISLILLNLINFYIRIYQNY